MMTPGQGPPGANVPAGAGPSAPGPAPVAVTAAARPPPNPAAAAASAQQAAAFAAASKQREKAASEANLKDLWTALIEEKAVESYNASRSTASDDSSAPSSSSSAAPPREATLLYIGPRSAGKSTLVNAYMYKDRLDEVPKATHALDYKYTRSSIKDALGVGEEKSVSHFWELGGGRSLTNLLDIPLTPNTIQDAMVVLAIDLSTPRISRLVEDVSFFLTLVKNRCDAIFAQLKSKGQGSLVSSLQSAARRRFGEGHADLSRGVDLLPIPVLICAHKFDMVAKTLEPEPLRILSRTLRALAHASGTSLLYTSRAHKDTLLKAYRARITAFVMASSTGSAGAQAAPKAPAPNFDHTQFIAVSAGQDSFASIGEPPGNASGKTPQAAWAAAFAKSFAPDAAGAAQLAQEDKEDVASQGDAAAASLDAEKLVDAANAARQEDLKRMARELDLRRKLNRNEMESASASGAIMPSGGTGGSSVRVR